MKQSTPIKPRMGAQAALALRSRKAGVQSGQYRTHKQQRRDWRREVY